MYTASLDKLSKWVTGGVVVLTMIFLLLVNFGTADNDFLVLLPVALMVVTLSITYFYSPKGYEVDLNDIAVIRKAGKFFISRKDIQSIKAIPDTDLAGSVRTFGNGGLFGYTGYFRNKIHGSTRWFVTQRKNYILITMKLGKKYVLSPDDVDGFLAATQL